MELSPTPPNQVQRVSFLRIYPPAVVGTISPPGLILSLIFKWSLYKCTTVNMLYSRVFYSRSRTISNQINYWGMISLGWFVTSVSHQISRIVANNESRPPLLLTTGELHFTPQVLNPSLRTTFGIQFDYTRHICRSPLRNFFQSDLGCHTYYKHLPNLDPDMRPKHSCSLGI